MKSPAMNSPISVYKGKKGDSFMASIDFQKIPENYIVLLGSMRRISGSTVVVRIFSVPLYKHIKGKNTPIYVSCDDQRKIFTIKPCNHSKRTLFTSGKYDLGFVVTHLTKDLILEVNKKHHVFVCFNPKHFGLEIIDFISDSEASELFPFMKKLGFKKFPLRETCNNGHGDLTLVYKKKVYSINISKACPKYNDTRTRTQLRHKLFGKALYQSFEAAKKINAKNILILNRKLLTSGIFLPETVEFLNDYFSFLTFTDFSDGWAETVAGEIEKAMKSSKFYSPQQSLSGRI